jgi:hypothetical protein
MSPATVRKWHSYIGLFIAPSVLFFALTGAEQLFNLHEAHGNYQPLAVVEKLSSVHKDQVFAFGDHHKLPEPQADAGKSGAGPGPGPAAQDDDDRTPPSTLMLKWFFLLVALCLVVSTAFGIWMGLTQIRERRLSWILLIAGTLIPVGLLVL